MKRGKIYACALLFLALTAVKMISPAAAADVREVLIPTISEDDDYRAMLASVQTSLRSDGGQPAVDAAPYTVTPPLEQMQQELEAMRLEHFADLPKTELSEPEPEPEPTPEPEPEPDCSDEGQPKIKRRPDGSWKCMFCDHMNPSGKDYCQKCGAEAFFDQP